VAAQVDSGLDAKVEMVQLHVRVDQCRVLKVVPVVEVHMTSLELQIQPARNQLLSALLLSVVEAELRAAPPVIAQVPAVEARALRGVLHVRVEIISRTLVVTEELVCEAIFQEHR
jgi:hypothetical protein